MNLPIVEGAAAHGSTELVRKHGDQFAELERTKEVLASCRAQNENLVVQNVKLTARLEALTALLSHLRGSLKSELDSIGRLVKEGWL